MPAAHIGRTAAVTQAPAQVGGHVCALRLWCPRPLRAVVLTALLATLGCAGAPSAPPEVRAARVCFEGVRVFDGLRDRGVLDVRVVAGRIAALAKGACEGAEGSRISGRGRTLLPGLIDAHSHNGGDSLQVQARFGVTTTIDMAAKAPWATAMRQEQRSSRGGGEALRRADLVSPGPPATVQGGHGTEYGVAVPTIDSPDDVGDWMRERKAEGADFVKVIYEHGTVIRHTVPTFDRETLQAVVAGAHAVGLKAVAHISSVAEAMDFVAVGGDGLAHVFHDRPARPNELARLRDAGTFVVSTLGVYAPQYGLRGGAALLDDADFLGPLSLRQRINLGHTRRRRPQDRAYAARPLAAIRGLHRAGVPILAGSDAPNRGTAWGVSLHHELELLVQAGLRPAEALTAATVAPARAFGLADRGHIAVGKRADLLLVTGNPMQDVRATRRIVGVWKRGLRIPRQAQEPDAFEGGSLAGAVGGKRPTVRPRELRPALVASTDAVRGGSSTVQLTRSAGTLRVATTTQPRSQGGSWAGVVWWPGSKPFAPADLRGARLELRVRGDGRPIRLMAFRAGRGARPVTLWLPTTTTWTTHRVHMAELGSDGRALSGILLSAGPEAGAGHFTVASLRLVPDRSGM